jgi:hypothetical protein
MRPGLGSSFPGVEELPRPQPVFMGRVPRSGMTVRSFRRRPAGGVGSVSPRVTAKALVLPSGPSTPAGHRTRYRGAPPNPNPASHARSQRSLVHPGLTRTNSGPGSL